MDGLFYKSFTIPKKREDGCRSAAFSESHQWNVRAERAISRGSISTPESGPLHSRQRMLTHPLNVISTSLAWSILENGSSRSAVSGAVFQKSPFAIRVTPPGKTGSIFFFCQFFSQVYNLTHQEIKIIPLASVVGDRGPDGVFTVQGRVGGSGYAALM